MRSKLDYHVPGSGPQDPLKLQVEQQLNAILIDTFEMAKDGMVVDGQDLKQENLSVSDVILVENTEEVAPFDSQLNNTLRRIIGEVEEETTQVTQLRRELPQKARNAYEQLVEMVDAEVTKSLQVHSLEGDVVVDLRESIPRIDAILDDYQQSLLDLSKVKEEVIQRRVAVDVVKETIEFFDRR